MSYSEETSASQQDNSRDPAAAWVRRTPRQQAQAAARYDREARETLAGLDAERTRKARAAAVAKALMHASHFPPAILRGVRKDGRPYTRDEVACLKDCVRDAWKTLKRYGSDVVTVLS